MDLSQSQRFGDLWLEQVRSAVLRVPSVAINNLEFNFLLNPAHPDFKKISHSNTTPFPFDVRLFRAEPNAGRS